MKVNLVKLSFFVVVLSLSTSIVYAQDWYMGIGAGTATLDIDLDTSDFQETLDDLNSIPGVSASGSIDDSDTAVKLFAGYNINENFSTEFGFLDLGKILRAEVTATSDGTVFPAGTSSIGEAISTDGLYIAAVGRLPISDLISLNGRVGYYSWDAEWHYAEAEIEEGSSFDDNDLFYGIGMDISWFGLFYEVYDLDGLDVDLIGISATFQFD